MLFIFDMDDVLYSYDWRLRMRLLTELTGHDLSELRRRWWVDEGEWAAEAGAFTDPEHYLAAFNAALGHDIPRQQWLDIRKQGMTPRPESLAIVREAAEHGQVTLLTNNGVLVGDHLPELAPELVPLFGLEHLRASAHYGARKPDPLVYRRVLERYGFEAERTFFADDMAVNVAGAASLGIDAHHYRDAAGMRLAVRGFIDRQRG